MNPLGEMTFATLKRRHWEVNLEKHERVVPVGDVHGDLRALMGVLDYAGVVAFPPSLDVGACHRDGDPRRGRPLTRSQVESIQWTGGTAAVLILGDVLDNRRGVDADALGVCGLTGTQTQLLEILAVLQRLAVRSGGRVVFVLGNHDVENALVHLVPNVRACVPRGLEHRRRISDVRQPRRLFRPAQEAHAEPFRTRSSRLRETIGSPLTCLA